MDGIWSVKFKPFKDVLDIQELQLKFQVNQIESVKTYYVQTTIINYLTH